MPPTFGMNRLTVVPDAAGRLPVRTKFGVPAIDALAPVGDQVEYECVGFQRIAAIWVGVL